MQKLNIRAKKILGDHAEIKYKYKEHSSVHVYCARAALNLN